MPFISAISKIELPYKIKQQDVKATASALFAENFPQVNRLIQVFDNTEIVTTPSLTLLNNVIMIISVVHLNIL